MARTIVTIVFFSALSMCSTILAGCPFCDPAVIENQIVYEDAFFRVLVDHAPRIAGHLLAVPKRHVVMAQEMTQEEWSDLHNIVPRIVQVFQQAYNTDQYIMLEKNGPFAGQSVLHVHFHLLPTPSHSSLPGIFLKIFDPLPKKLRKEETQEVVLRLRPYFEKTN